MKKSAERAAKTAMPKATAPVVPLPVVKTDLQQEIKKEHVHEAADIIQPSSSLLEIEKTTETEQPVTEILGSDLTETAADAEESLLDEKQSVIEKELKEPNDVLLPTAVEITESPPDADAASEVMPNKTETGKILFKSFAFSKILKI